jgi:hypothetical protein
VIFPRAKALHHIKADFGSSKKGFLKKQEFAGLLYGFTMCGVGVSLEIRLNIFSIPIVRQELREIHGFTREQCGKRIADLRLKDSLQSSIRNR